MGNSP